MARKNILCFGDSNTFGYRAVDGGRYSEKERWPALVQGMLGEDYHIIEEGLSGRTTCFDDPQQEGRAGIHYITPCLNSHKPIDLLIVMLGTNDAKELFGASALNIALALKRLLLKAMHTECWRDGKPNILTVVPKAIDERYEQTYAGYMLGRGCSEKTAVFAQEYRKITDLIGCRYFDANEVITSLDEIDYVHLSVQGHRELAKGIAEEIRKIFSE